jgi:RHS repeat-associated protein
MVAAQTIDGLARQTWALDPAGRFRTSTAHAWSGGIWQATTTSVNHYASDSDSPAWVVEDSASPSDVTRYVHGMEGQLALQTGTAGERLLYLTDLRGDVMGTLPIADGASEATWTSLSYRAADEFGNPTDLTTGTRMTGDGRSPGRDGRYGWLGAQQRSADALGGALLMGVRLYDPGTGRFQSVDSIPGGNATAYDYCAADPVNCTDISGRYMTVGMNDRGPRVAPRSPWPSAYSKPISSKPFKKLPDCAGPKPGARFDPFRPRTPPAAPANPLLDMFSTMHPPCDPSICRRPPRSLPECGDPDEPQYCPIGRGIRTAFRWVGEEGAPIATGCGAAVQWSSVYSAWSTAYAGPAGLSIISGGSCVLGGIAGAFGAAEAFG